MAGDLKWRIEQIPTSNRLPAVLLNLYQEVFAEAEVYQEDFSLEEVQGNLAKADLLFAMKVQQTEDFVGFAAGEFWFSEPPADRAAYGVLRNEVPDGPIFYISEMGVRSDLQGKGLGKLLLTKLHSAARKEGCLAFILKTHENNQQALGLYIGYGFKYLIGPDGEKLRGEVIQRRKDGREHTDLRPYLCLIDR